MIAANTEDSPTSPALAEGRRLRSSACDEAYGSPFWFTYAAHVLLMVAVSMLYRYSDLVKFLVGPGKDPELPLGSIFGVGMVGSLVMRFAQGRAIDANGPRMIWLGSVAMFSLSCLLHLWVTTVDGPFIYVLRILYHTSLAGAFGSSITFCSRRAPVTRVAEVVGTLGTSGFVGMMFGSALGDYLFDGVIDRTQLDRMFLLASLLGLVATVFGWFAIRGYSNPVRHRHPPMFALMRRYNPGTILLTGVATGIALSFPITFLRPYTEEKGMQQMFLFFSVYAPAAFVARLALRRVPGALGIRPMIIIGLSSLALAMCSFIFVTKEWHLVLPAIFCAIGHAVVFPAVVGGGSTMFPARYRGLGTTVMLAAFDLGNLLGGPIMGSLLGGARAFDLPAYPVMFVSVAVLILAIVGIYAWRSRGIISFQPRINHAARKRGKKGPRFSDRIWSDASKRLSPTDRSGARSIPTSKAAVGNTAGS